MHLLLLNQFYPPDVAPTGQYLHEVAQALVARGHRVTVLCSRRAYDGGQTFAREDTRDGVKIRRLRAFGFGRRTFVGKLLDYGSFTTGLSLRLLRLNPRPDAIVALTTPPYLGLIARTAARLRGTRHLHWIMDLYPDVIAAHGALRKGRWPYRLLQHMTRQQFRGAAQVIAISPDMATAIAAYTPAETTVYQIPLWSTLSPDPTTDAARQALRQTRGWGADDVVLLYSGNMGLGHRFDEFLEAARLLGGDPRLRWVFAGGGKRLGQIRTFQQNHPDLKLEILPYCPSAQLAAHLASADIHLASLDSRWQGGIVPSKLQNSFAVGRPVLFVGAGNSSMARWIRESQGGWVVPEDNVTALRDAIQQAMQPDDRARRGEAARQFARTRFDRATNIGALCDLLASSGPPCHT